MSRSNVPANQPGGWPPAAQPQQGYAGQDTTGRPAQRPPVQGAPQPQSHYLQQPAPQAPGYPPFPEPQSPYADPNAFRGPSPYAQQPQQRPPFPGEATQPTAGRPAQPGASLGQAPSYLPQFDPYVPPSQPAPYAQQPGFGQQPQAPAAPAFGQPFGQPPQPAPSYPQQAPSFPQQASYDSQRAAPQFGQRPPAPTAPSAQPPQPLQESGLSQLAALRAPAQQRSAEPGYQAPAPSFPQPSAFQQQPDAWRQPMGAPAAAKPQPAAHGFDHGDFLSQAPGETTAGRRAGQQPGDLNFGEWPRAAAPSFGQHGPGQQQPGFGQEPRFDTGEGFADGYEQQAGEYEQAQDGDDEEHYDYEEPKKRSSIFMVAGALVAAVVVGSGLAFVYQKFGPAPATQTAAVIKSDSAPAKVKPAEPGGKQFANSDSKVMGRLTENGAPITTSSTGAGNGADADAGAPRKVSTIAVGRDGSLAAPAPASAEAPAAAAAPPAVAVPGLTIVDGFGGRQPPPRTVSTTVTPPAAALPPQHPVVVTPPPAATVKPVVTARAAVPAATDAIDADVTMPGAAEAPPAVKKPAAVPKKKVVDAYGAAASAVTAAGTPPAAAAPPVTSTGGNGYIPVLASVPVSAKSRMDALKQFADMQQKYANVLGDKTPDVQEANLGEKGTYHRLLAGPPGSKEQASQICSQLKAAGYSGCWVTAY